MKKMVITTYGNNAVKYTTFPEDSIPFMIIMALAILILCIFPEIVTWLPDKIMGKALGY